MLMKILCKQNSRVTEVQRIVKNYLEISSRSSKVSSLKFSKSKKSTSQRSSKKSCSSSHSKSVQLNAEAESILSQTKEQFERKAELLE